ncbi:MAG TPA: pyridoxamine 5'-phosphate oxidase family protein [Clostridia bacterium]|nr:pyridoxamine 5'-phosphate oxidase family protein [Clostridia bacterium]
MTMSECIDVLNRCEYGFLGTVNEDGSPYVVPVNYVYYEGCIVFHTALEGHKMENLKGNNRVCFSVCQDARVIPEKFSTAYTSVIAFGEAEIVDDGDVKKRLLLALSSRLAPGHPMPCDDEDIKRTGVVRIRVRHLSGKKRSE